MAAGIYIHIPFCKQKCFYCDFISSQGCEEDMELYKEALLKEIESTEIDEPVDSVFFGGGTPSVYKVEYIEEILKCLVDKYDILMKDCEITIEVNPGTVDYEKLKRYKNAGINRLSIGLQSADNDELKLLGRIHTYEKFLDTFKEARNVGFDNINIDLMSAIPYQTTDLFMNTLKKVVELNPEHISAYSLIIEQGTPFYEKYSEEAPLSYAIPSEETDRKIYHMTKEFLAQNGYERYEISNYSKRGYECKHNIKYWSRINYYGFGVAAASLVNNLRYTNIADRDKYIEIYLKNNDFRCKREIEKIDLNGQMEEYIFLGLRKMQGISLSEFEKVFGKKLREVYGKIPDRMINEGLCEETDGFFRLTEKGIDVSNMIFVEFML